MTTDAASAPPANPAEAATPWPAACAPALDADSALALLESSPAALAAVASDGTLRWANAAACRLLGDDPRGRSLPELLRLTPQHAERWQALLARADAAPLDLPAGRHRLRLRCSALPDGGRSLALTAIDDLAQAQADAGRLSELLDLAKDFGRLGLWERDVRTLQGRWDAQVYRFWGLAPDSGMPDFEAASLSVVEPDRTAVEETFRRSLQCAGTYAQRFRVRRPDGTLCQLHSQWVVKNGADGRPERVLGIMMDDTEAWSLARSRSALESQLALAVDLVGIGTWRHDLASGRMDFNRQGWAVFDLDPHLQGLTIDKVRALVHPEDLPRVRAASQAALESDRPMEIEARWRRRDGSWHTLQTRRVVERDGKGEPVAFLGVAFDASERVEAARRAHELGRRFDLATRTAGIGYWSIERGAERAQWSDALRAMHGLAAEQPVPTLAEWLQHFVHADDRTQVQQRFLDWTRRGDSVELEFRLCRADGSVRDVVTHSRVEGDPARPLLFGIAIDLTERRRADMALRQAAERAALAARGAGLGTWELDQRTGRSIWDEQMWRLRGREPRAESPTQQEWMCFVHPDDVQATEQRIDQIAASEQTANHEFRVVWPDGSVRWIASRSAPVRDEHGCVQRRIGVNWDITDARNAEVARRERELALRESQAKSRFLARMSHELRTPLNAVLGFSQLLIADEADPGGERARRLAHIRSAGEHLLALIDDVLDLASLESGEVRIALAPVALQPLVETTLPLLEPLCRERGVTVHTGDLSTLPLADPVRLRQVLLNLLSNAVKYNRPGGRVSVEGLRRGGGVVIRVADTGRGMNDGQLRRLFEPFNRLGLETEGIAGTGIGLAIVKSLVERMGGSVHVDSTPGAGTLFEVRLADAAAARPGMAPAAAWACSCRTTLRAPPSAAAPG